MLAKFRPGFLIVGSILVLWIIVQVLFISGSWERLLGFFWDDTFYYTAISRNIAQGLGPTPNGINLTNGFQPLWGLVLVPVFWLYTESLNDPIWFLMALQIVLVVGGVLLIYRTIRSAFNWWIAAPASILSLWPGFNLLLGQEQALFFFIHAMLSAMLVAEFAVKSGKYIYSRAIAFGLLSGLLFLTRTDALMMLAPLWLIWLSHIYVQASSSAHLLGQFLLRAALMFGAAAPLGLGYILWNVISFGKPVPISSSLKSTFPIPYLRLENILALESFYLAGALILGFTFVSLIQLKHWQTWSCIRRVALAMSIGTLINLFFIAFFVDWAAMSNQAVVVVVPTALVIGIIWNRLVRVVVPLKHPLARCLPLIITLIVITGYQIVRFRNMIQFPGGTYGTYTIVTEEIRGAFENDTVFAYTDSTVFGYFSGYPTINLDGLVNNWEFQEYLHEAAFDEYAQQVGITILVTRWNLQTPVIEDCFDYYFLSRLERPALPVKIAIPIDALIALEQFPKDSPRFGVYLWDFDQIHPYQTCETLGY